MRVPPAPYVPPVPLPGLNPGASEIFCPPRYGEMLPAGAQHEWGEMPRCRRSHFAHERLSGRTWRCPWCLAIGDGGAAQWRPNPGAPQEAAPAP